MHWGLRLHGNNYKITEMLANPVTAASIIMINLQLYIEIMRLGVGARGREEQGGFS